MAEHVLAGRDVKLVGDERAIKQYRAEMALRYVAVQEAADLLRFAKGKIEHKLAGEVSRWHDSVDEWLAAAQPEGAASEDK